MEITESSLRERYSQMDTHELLELSASGGLTEMAAAILNETLAERGVKEEEKDKAAEAFESEWRKDAEINNALAPMGARVIAQIIDSIVAALILILPIIIFDIKSDNLAVMAILAYFGYLLLQDGLPNGQSVGKWVMKLSVVNIKTGKPCSLLASFIRNLFLFFLGIIDLLFAISRYRQRLGDRVVNTVVVKAGKNIFTEQQESLRTTPNTAPKRFPW